MTSPDHGLTSSAYETGPTLLRRVVRWIDYQREDFVAGYTAAELIRMFCYQREREADLAEAGWSQEQADTASVYEPTSPVAGLGAIVSRIAPYHVAIDWGPLSVGCIYHAAAPGQACASYPAEGPAKPLDGWATRVHYPASLSGRGTVYACCPRRCSGVWVTVEPGDPRLVPDIEGAAERHPSQCDAVDDRRSCCLGFAGHDGPHIRGVAVARWEKPR